MTDAIDPVLEQMRLERIQKVPTEIVHTREALPQEIEDLVKRLAVSLGKLEAQVPQILRRLAEIENRPTPIVEAANDGEHRQTSGQILQMIIQTLPVIDELGLKVDELQRAQMVQGSISHDPEWMPQVTEMMETVTALQSTVLMMKGDQAALKDKLNARCEALKQEVNRRLDQVLDVQIGTLQTMKDAQ